MTVLSLKTVTGAELRRLVLRTASRSSLALYFHCYALANRLARERRRERVDVQQDAIENALLEAFSQLYKANELLEKRSDRAGAVADCRDLLESVVHCYRNAFSEEPHFYDDALEQLREWQRRGEEVDDFDVEFATDGEA